MNFLRRISLSRLLLLCGLVVAIAISAATLASALGTGATPAPKPLAQAVHDALAAPKVDGVSANITLTNHLLEGANLASSGGEGGGPASSPLLNGGSGRLWASNDGRLRIELQAEQGDTQIIYDGHTVKIYDASKNTLYEYTPTQQASSSAPAEAPADSHEPPSLAKVEEGLAHLREHVNVSDAIPANVAGQPAYTVRVSPKEGGSLIGGAELSFDAAHGLPLRAAIYSSTSSSPVIELAATEVSYGPVDASVFEIDPPANAKVQQLNPEGHEGTGTAQPQDGSTKVTSHGQGITTIHVLETPAKTGSTSSSGETEELPKVSINGTSASELRTALGTILTFERSGVRYVVAGALPPAAIEALARGL
jgi:outer membrane lipoprotein-sorting protein